MVNCANFAIICSYKFLNVSVPMLSVRQLFLLLSTLYVLLLFIALLISRSLWFYPAELNLQLERQQQEVRSVETILRLTNDSLLDYTQKNAEWIEHMNIPLQQISRNKLLNSSYVNADIVILLDNQKHPLLTIEYDGAQTKYHAVLEHYLPNLNTQAEQDYIFIHDKLFAVAIAPVQSSKQPTNKGWMILLKTIDESFFRSLEEISQLRIKPLLPSEAQLPHLSIATPLSQPVSQFQRCLMNQQEIAVLCFELSPIQGAKPEFLDKQAFSMFAFIVFAPLLLFAIFLSVLLKPLDRGINLIKESGEKDELRDIDFTYWLPIKELKDFKNTYNAMIRMVQRQQKQLEQLSNTDKLTNIPNRRAFDQHLADTWSRLSRQRRSASIALVMVDIDYFKPYNDYYGHQQGDNALQLVAQALAGLARRTDEIVARFGGEEFALIVFIENDYELEQFRARLNSAIAKLKIEHEKSTVNDYLTVSSGIAWLQNPGVWLENHLPENWIEEADKALYLAKNNGRNTQEVSIINELLSFN